MSSGPSLGLLPQSRVTPSSPKTLPRPPRCLTPHPSQLRFPPRSSSPSSSPSISPEDLISITLNQDPFDVLQPLFKPPSSPHPITTSASRGIPIGLKMSSLSPTDSSFGTIPPILLSPSVNRAWNRHAMGQTGRRIPLSPSAKKYMDNKDPRKGRPDPIQIIHRSSAPALRTAMTARPKGRVRIVSPAVGRSKEGGSVPLPKTPWGDIETPGKTAMPVTSRRIGRNQDTASEGEIEVELDVGWQSDADVPVLKDEPSPGWSDVLSASV